MNKLFLLLFVLTSCINDYNKDQELVVSPKCGRSFNARKSSFIINSDKDLVEVNKCIDYINIESAEIYCQNKSTCHSLESFLNRENIKYVIINDRNNNSIINFIYKTRIKPNYNELHRINHMHNSKIKQSITRNYNMERTLSIIKPDATGRNIIGKIISKFEEKGLSIVAIKKLHLSKEQAQAFYYVHKDRPFYNDLVEFMISGPVIVQVLEGDNAISLNREIMGATDPKEAVAGTIRKEFAQSKEANSVHGSDSVDSAKEEIKFFFEDKEIVSN